ncbi:MAG: hypothetical protein KBC00_03955 [Candidatus Levybacteria bacterium]|nr:hypothetical protein [Candidatus Levybacteria bacterium]MBP9814931.1 hypothetical protein [Candidatus Levybacteria bacterium]
MSEQREHSSLKHTRRKALGLGVAIGITSLLGKDSGQKTHLSPVVTVEEGVDKTLPKNILSPEELKEMNVAISQGVNTEIFLRKGILDLPIFKDLIKRKTGGLEIGIIDAKNLDWRKTQKFSPDARAVFDFGHGPERARALVASHRDRYAGIAESIKNGLGQMQEGSEEKRNAERALVGYETQASNYNKELAKDNDVFFDFYLNHFFDSYTGGNSAGVYISSDRLKQEDTENQLPESAKGKNYIFLAVGGYDPNPEYSYPNPHLLDTIVAKKDFPLAGESDYAFDRGSDFKRKIPSFSLLHEFSHYVTPDESEADKLAYNFLVDAWDKYQKGDDSGYAVVFKNDRGITITKKLYSQSTSTV